MKVYKDANGDRRTPADVGATFISAERAAELGWTEVNEDYIPPVDKPTTKKAEMDSLLKDYNETIEGLKNNILTARLDAATAETKIAAAQTAFTKAKADYLAARAAIVAKYKAV